MNAPSEKLRGALREETVDKGNGLKLENCEVCGHCSCVCPSEADLRNIILSAKQKTNKLECSPVSISCCEDRLSRQKL